MEALRSRQAELVADNVERSKHLAERLRRAGVPDERLALDLKSGHLVSKVTDKDLKYLDWFEMRMTSGRDDFVVEAA
jgi:hypothetical protein